MFNLDKLKDNNAIFWAIQWPKIRETAAKCGWAVGIHGSAVHDLDLMAMPWIEKHVNADELAERLSAAVDNSHRGYVKSEDNHKPNNRVVYTIFAGDSYIDMNVIKEQTYCTNK